MIATIALAYFALAAIAAIVLMERRDDLDDDKLSWGMLALLALIAPLCGVLAILCPAWWWVQDRADGLLRRWGR